MTALTLSKDAVDEEMLQRPRKWDIHFIRNFMFTFGLVSSVFDYLITFILFNIFTESQVLYQSGWFIFSILTELVTLMVIRTRKPFFKTKPASALLLSSFIVATVTLLFPYTPLASLAPIPFTLVGILILLIGFYVIALEITKKFFYRRNPGY